MRKIVLFKGGVETLGFFSEQLATSFEKLGHKVFMFDYDKEAKSSYDLLRFYEKDNTVMLSFNFHGVCNEEILRDEDGVYIWERLDIPCVNIVVDHPSYYDRFMNQLPPVYYQISIDKNHMDYMKRFYPEIGLGPFVPLGGTRLDEKLYPAIPFDEREVDVVFTGSWAEPSFFGEFMKQEGEEYHEFYMDVLKTLIDNPDCTFEEIFEPKIRAVAEDADEITDDALKMTYAHLVCFDMYVRYFYRGELIKSLVDSGIKVKCIGGGWDKLKCEHPENLTCMEYTSSLECLLEIQKAKVSINVMPWFKRGAHDRIFNSMLNGAVCFTDSSEYLDEILTDGKDCIMFSLHDIKGAADILKEYLADEKRLREISMKGYELSVKAHTWNERAKELSAYIESL